MLLEVRLGCLRTHSYKPRSSKEEKGACCGECEETTEHVFIECEDIHMGVC